MFKKSLRVEIEHKGSQVFPDGQSTGYMERDDLFSSVAFWYQLEPHRVWPPLPPAAARLPFTDQILLKGHEAVAGATHSDASIEVQSVGGVTDGKQLWFRPGAGGGWVEASFQLAHEENLELLAKMIHSFDYGIYRVKLDGQPVGQFDLYSSNVTPVTHKLGKHQLAAGPHSLRFECAGKSPESSGYYLGFDALTAQIPAYNRPVNFDLRTIQVVKPQAQTP